MSRTTRRKTKKRSAKQNRADLFNKIGGILVVLCIGCLVVGRVIVSLFFPETQGQEIPPGLWPVLIIIWSIGISGLCLLFAGWFLNKFN